MRRPQECQEQGCGVRQSQLRPELWLGEGSPWSTMESASHGVKGAGVCTLWPSVAGWALLGCTGTCTLGHVSTPWGLLPAARALPGRKAPLALVAGTLLAAGDGCTSRVHWPTEGSGAGSLASPRVHTHSTRRHAHSCAQVPTGHRKVWSEHR